MDQSAMIAGFLLIGYSVTTPFSRTTKLFAKNGMLIAITLITIGWLLMWFADNIYWLLASRLIIGLGAGYGIGQLNIYLNEFHKEAGDKFKPFITIFILSGVVISFIVGPFVSFRLFPILATGLSFFVMFLIVLLPPTPVQLFKANQMKNLKKLLLFLKPDSKNINEEIEKVRVSANSSVEELSLTEILKDSELRMDCFKFAFMIYGQQFTGMPSTLVYTQFLFKDVDFPEYYAIIYILNYFIMNVISGKITGQFNKRNVLLLSNFLVAIILILNIFVEYYKVTKLYFKYTLVLSMNFYLICHTFGLGTIPVSYIQPMFDSKCYTSLTLFYIAFSSILAVVLTKIFQVLYTYYGLIVSFIFFFVNSFIMFSFTVIFIPKHIKPRKIK